MKNLFKTLSHSAVALAIVCGCLNPIGGLQASHHHKKPFTSKIGQYFKDYPWIGLVANDITYGPINISNVDLNEQGRIIFAKPDERIKGTLRYKIDADHLDSFHLYHLVVGIKKVGAQDCVCHTFGVWDSKGKGKFKLQAPTEKGVYEVRFSYFEGATCQSAREAWDLKTTDSSNAATIAVLIVE